MLKKGMFVLILLLLINSCYAAKLHGTIYDISLEKVSNVMVEVNSSPTQRVISKEGNYEFEIPIGSYKITTKQVKGNITLASAEEIIFIIDDGSYVLDLFLFPSLEEEESLLNETNLTIDDEYFKTTNYLLIIVVLLLIILIAMLSILYFRSKKKQPIVVEGAEDIQRVISIIKSQGGRTTQKEIRKHMPLSEAKVSLLISELESKGIIEKIKKGRGNIIILKR